MSNRFSAILFCKLRLSDADGIGLRNCRMAGFGKENSGIMNKQHRISARII
jgi:hypothetical protein